MATDSFSGRPLYKRVVDLLQAHGIRNADELLPFVNEDRTAAARVALEQVERAMQKSAFLGYLLHVGEGRYQAVDRPPQTPDVPPILEEALQSRKPLELAWLSLCRAGEEPSLCEDRHQDITARRPVERQMAA